jgi:hypothetical protein
VSRDTAGYPRALGFLRTHSQRKQYCKLPAVLEAQNECDGRHHVSFRRPQPSSNECIQPYSMVLVGGSNPPPAVSVGPLPPLFQGQARQEESLTDQGGQWQLLALDAGADGHATNGGFGTSTARSQLASPR